MIAQIQQEQKLDELVFTHYGNLDHFNEVLEVNQHLVHKMFLDVGDKVILPVFQESVKEIKIKALWS